MILASDTGVRITMAAVRKNVSLLQLSRNAAWNGESVDICRRMSTAVPMKACRVGTTRNRKWHTRPSTIHPITKPPPHTHTYQAGTFKTVKHCIRQNHHHYHCLWHLQQRSPGFQVLGRFLKLSPGAIHLLCFCLQVSTFDRHACTRPNTTLDRHLTLLHLFSLLGKQWKRGRWREKGARESINTRGLNHPKQHMMAIQTTKDHTWQTPTWRRH